MGKTGRKNKTYSTEFKVNVIMDMREHHMGYRETARKYSLVRQSEASAASMVQRWERIFLEEGAEGLMKERRGRLVPLAEQGKEDRRSWIKRSRKI
ncbi:MAG: hypothetical protein ACLTZI_10740 [[Eubacterium] siraeum]